MSCRHGAAMNTAPPLNDHRTLHLGCTNPAHSRPLPRERFGELLVQTVAAEGPGPMLVDEWDRMARRRTHLRTANSWGVVSGEIEHLDQLLVAAGFGQEKFDDDGDHILWHLVALAETDTLAARIVMQRVMPALFAIAKRRSRILPGGMPEAIGEVMPAAWLTIRTFPHRRRTRKIAANLALDTEYHAFVRDARLKRVEEIPMQPDVMGRHRTPVQDPVVDLELAQVLADAASRGVSGAMIDLLRQFGNGKTSDMLGAESGWSARTIRNHRAAAVAAVREVLHDID